MKYLVATLLSIGLLSCSDKEVIIQKYGNGQKKVTYVILKGSKDNPIDFMYRAYFDNGVLMKEGIMKNVKEEGEWKYYFDNGKIASIGNFQNGIRSGKFLRYYESGQIEQDGFYINGEVNQSNFFHRNGTIKNKEVFDPTPFIIDSPTAWTESQKKKISSRCNHVLQFEYKNSEMFCNCMIDSVSRYVEFTALDTLSDYDKSLVYRVFMKTGACDGLFY